MVYKNHHPKLRGKTAMTSINKDTCALLSSRRRRQFWTTTGPRTRSYQRHMDDSNEVIRDWLLWDDGMEDVLVNFLYDDTIAARIQDGKITHNDHVRLARQLSDYGIKKFNSKQVKGKIARLKRRQREFTDLMRQTGLGWDPDRKAPVVSEEHWANAIKVRNSFKHFKTNGCPGYKELCAIFGCSVAMGTLHRASTEPAPTSEKEDLLDEEL